MHAKPAFSSVDSVLRGNRRVILHFSGCDLRSLTLSLIVMLSDCSFAGGRVSAEGYVGCWQHITVPYPATCGKAHRFLSGREFGKETSGEESLGVGRRLGGGRAEIVES